MGERIRLRRITEEDIGNLPTFDDDRDTIGKDFRMGLHRELEEEYARNKSAGGDPGFSCSLVSGPKGVGKTNLMSLFCIPYRRAGYEVISNLSLLYGWHIEGAVDIFAFSKMLPGRCILVLDEIQALLSRYRQANTGQMEFVGGIAGLRKQRIHLLGGTSQEPEVANNFIRECDWIYYPSRRKRYPQMSDGHKHYPEWCHLRIEAVGPKPLRGKTVGESFGIGVNRTKPKRKVLRGITPANIYQAAALQYSFAGLPKGKAVGQNVMAKDMRYALNEMDVIDFDAEDAADMEEAEDSPAREEFNEAMEQDRLLLVALWGGLRQASIANDGLVQMDYMMFNLKALGFDYSQSEVEKTLARWTNYRTGHDVDLSRVAKLFSQTPPGASP